MALLEIRNLRVSYGAVEAIHGVDLDIEEKSITAILGSNGAGKTTIINAVSGMLRRSGGLMYGGRPLSPKPDRVVRSGIVQIPEGRKIFPGLTVEENLRLGAYTTSARDLNRLMEEQFALFPRLKERINQDAGTLSGGEQQMLAIARGLMGRPGLLMLDEPSLGLAPIIVKDVFRIIENIRARGITVMLVEQNAKKSLGICDKGYVIENGKIVLSGTGRELLNNEQIAKAYLGAGRN
ncbi:MAG: ABC transporter ATP-binding protein [Treponema sp.]|jgi:branched-chain amino acid transport system ATP-binding protein|nr:ABC transporter ATP-binding protein [Treponema sp.]